MLSASDVWAKADIILKIRPPQDDEVELAREGATLISLIQPAQNGDLLERLAKRKVNAIAMDAVPRISRAQSMDALSSMANIAGYRAMVEAASEFGLKFMVAIRCPDSGQPPRQISSFASVDGVRELGL